MSTEDALVAALESAEVLLRKLSDATRSKRLAKLRRFLDDPSLRVVVFGEFSRGKSTLINALLERPVLPAKLVPTTGQVTRVVFGHSEELRIKDSYGKVTRWGLENLGDFVLLDLEGNAKANVEVIEVAIRHPLLKEGVVLIDTPGVCEREPQTRRAKNEIAFADLVLVVLDAKQALTQNEQDFALEFLRVHHKPVMLVVNFMNLLEEKDQEEVRARINRWCQANLGDELEHRWLEVDALSALKRAQGRPVENTTRDQTGTLREFLSSCKGLARERIQRQARRGQIRADLAEITRVNADILTQMRSDRTRLAAERQDRLATAERTLRTLTTESVGQSDHLGDFAQVRLNASGQRLEESLPYCASSSNVEWAIHNQLDTHLQDAIRAIERRAFVLLNFLAGGELPPSESFTLREEVDRAARISIEESIDETIPEILDATVRFGRAFAIGMLGQLLVPIPGVGAGIGMALWHLWKKSPETLTAETATRLLPVIRAKWQEITAPIPESAARQFEARLRTYVDLVTAQRDELRHLESTPAPEFDLRLELARATATLHFLLTKSL